jgi:hypothetical protein
MIPFLSSLSRLTCKYPTADITGVGKKMAEDKNTPDKKKLDLLQHMEENTIFTLDFPYAEIFP